MYMTARDLTSFAGFTVRTSPYTTKTIKTKSTVATLGSYLRCTVAYGVRNTVCKTTLDIHPLEIETPLTFCPARYTRGREGMHVEVQDNVIRHKNYRTRRERNTKNQMPGWGEELVKRKFDRYSKSLLWRGRNARPPPHRTVPLRQTT